MLTTLTYVLRPDDTSEEVRRLQVAAIRSLSAARRVQMAIEMSEVAARISAIGKDRRSVAEEA